RKFGIQQKLLTALILGFMGFIVYFMANSAISNENQELMTALVEQHLPALEAAEGLSQSLGLVRNTIVRGSFSATMEEVVDINSNHERVLAQFRALNSNPLFDQQDLAKAEERYFQAYKSSQELFQNVVAGISELSSIHELLKTHSQTLQE